MTIAGIPVGGLDPQAASQHVLQVYTTPVEAQYGDAVIQISPSAVGFEVDLESMLAAADLVRTGGSFWGGFWDYLWNREPTPVAIPLRSSLTEDRLRSYLANEIASRYDIPPEPAQPIPGTAEFAPGRAGQVLDIDRAVILMEDALRSPSNRTIALTFQRSAAARPTLENLKVLLEQTINLSGFDGIIGFYMLDLQTGQEVHFALDNGQAISTSPDVAFTASSTMKIPILVSFFIKNGPAPLDEQTTNLIVSMLSKSENPPSDALMERLDINRGPLIVTEDMQKIGLESTFIAGFYCDPINPCPLLARYLTPANQRLDVFTDPDVYNQTTASDMGMLLADIYQCATSGGGSLAAVYPGQITKEVCQQIITLLSADKNGVLIQAGVPGGTILARKHGWTPDPFGVIKNFSDIAIVYSPSGNYVITIYAYHPVQIVFDDANRMFASLSRAVYNYFNLPNQ
jgi:beta-lactamase class A